MQDGIGVTLGVADRRRLLVLVEQLGEREAQRRLAVGARTLARATAGFRIRRATATAIRLVLDVEERAASAG